MRLKIVQVGEPVLRKKAVELGKEEIRSREIQELIEWMRETMYDAPGVGLAAPQVGLSLQLAVLEDKPEYLAKIAPEVLKEKERKPIPFQVIINPKLTLIDNELLTFYEGCLSLVGFTAQVARARRVNVECLDHRAEPLVIEASGWHARILQHEIDHLQGAVYIDRMVSQSLSSMENYNRFQNVNPMKSAR